MKWIVFLYGCIKKSLFLLLLLLSVAAAAQTGRKSDAFRDKFIGDLNVGMGTSCNGVKPMELGGNIGYRFIPSVYAFIHGGTLYGLCHGERSYAKSEVLGGGLGYTIHQADWVAIELRGTVSSSVGNADWKHTAYDANLLFRIGGGRLKMNIGAGFRHISSRTAGFGTYNGFYGTIGFGL